MGYIFSCNFNPPCQPCDQRQPRQQSSGIPIKQAFSETALDTITTVTVSGVPLQRRDMGKCATTTSCQTEEPQHECMMTKRKVSITQDSATKCDLQKKNSCSDCVATQAVSLLPKQSCLKIYSQKFEYDDSQISSELCRAVRPSTCEKVQSVCSHVRPLTCEKVQPNCSQVPPPTCEKVGPGGSEVSPPACGNVQSDCSQVPLSTRENVRPDCSQEPPPTFEKVRSVCLQVSSLTFSQVQTKGCQPLGPQIQSQGCMTVSTTRRPCCHKPPPQVQHSNAETQTRWCSILVSKKRMIDLVHFFFEPHCFNCFF